MNGLNHMANIMRKRESYLFGIKISINAAKTNYDLLLLFINNDI